MSARILIADDHAVARGRLSEFIASQGPWEICATADNGQQAVEKAAELRPDIVILDLAMPVMDGLRAAREIGKILPFTPIVLFTLHKVPMLELEAKKAGIRQVVSKPDTQELLNVITKLLEDNRAERTSETNELLVSASGPLDPIRAVSIQLPPNDPHAAAVPEPLKEDD